MTERKSTAAERRDEDERMARAKMGALGTAVKAAAHDEDGDECGVWPYEPAPFWDGRVGFCSAETIAAHYAAMDDETLQRFFAPLTESRAPTRS